MYNIILSCGTLAPSPATSESSSGKDKHTDNYTETDTLTHRGHAPRVSLPLEIGTNMSDYEVMFFPLNIGTVVEAIDEDTAVYKAMNYFLDYDYDLSDQETQVLEIVH
jgi:hypothetical protein